MNKWERLALLVGSLLFVLVSLCLNLYTKDRLVKMLLDFLRDFHGPAVLVAGVALAVFITVIYILSQPDLLGPTSIAYRILRTAGRHALAAVRSFLNRG